MTVTENQVQPRKVRREDWTETRPKETSQRLVDMIHDRPTLSWRENKKQNREKMWEHAFVRNCISKPTKRTVNLEYGTSAEIAHETIQHIPLTQRKAFFLFSVFQIQRYRLDLDFEPVFAVFHISNFPKSGFGRFFKAIFLNKLQKCSPQG